MSEQQYSEIISLLTRMDADIREANKRLDEQIKSSNEKFEKWDDRYFQLVKDQGNTARTIIIAAASVVVLAPVLGVAADFVRHLAGF